MTDYTPIILQDQIEQEKAGQAYQFTPEDRCLLDEMLAEIKSTAGVDFHWYAELDLCTIRGAGEIVARYIRRFPSQGVRSMLVVQLVSDKVEGCAQLLLELYRDLQASPDFASGTWDNASGLSIQYDHAFWRLKPKRIKQELLALVSNPRGAYVLPHTLGMLASWKLPEVRDILVRCLDMPGISAEGCGFPPDSEDGQRYTAFVKRQLMFAGILGLKHYPSAETLALLHPCAASTDKDVHAAAEKTLQAIRKRLALKED